ncbi:MAG: alanine--glyoxylate aminotransferase family protein [Opitutales bacterium]|jgi:aspartate aminotransferase-like enzyme
MISYKLFSPGPVAISDKTYEAMTHPVMGHRSGDFVELYQAVQPGLQKLFATESPVFLSTSSAWGLMEGAIRNVSSKRVLNCMCGAFSDKWFDVSRRCGKEATDLRFEWGRPVEPEAVRKELEQGKYDAITLVHNETSTGVMNPLSEIMAVVREFPEVISIVDTVSSFSALPTPMDQLGVDVMLTGTQKALAMPPGLALFAVSERAMERASSMEGRGYYFDFLEFQKNHEKGMTPSTPVIPLIHALRSKLDDIAEEGLDARYARHRLTNACTRRWMEQHGFRLFPDEKNAAVTLCCIDNCRELDLVNFNKALQSEKKFSINCGYGKIKGKTFRISNMGDETEETMAELFNAMNDLIERFLP